MSTCVDFDETKKIFNKFTPAENLTLGGKRPKGYFR